MIKYLYRIRLDFLAENSHVQKVQKFK